MKKIILPLIAIIFCSKAFAQDEMKNVWTTKLDHKTELNELDENSNTIISSSEKMISVIDANTGKVKW